ncbi:polysaccharide pyruvyl transferase family protein [Janibacter sp. GS2]|uniref:polysaccharide pyruvyl transferase family protein n=1 Tax=Janibacter sp. GS2 TaxID=3442646 RepID=UPI003EBCFC01
MPRGKRVALVGGVGGGNTGNEVSLDVVRDLLRAARDDLRFCVVTPMPVETTTRGLAHPGEPVLPLRAPRSTAGPRTVGAVLRRALAEGRHTCRVVHEVGGMRALVVCGTGVLDDFEEPPWGMPWSLLLWAAVARVRRRPFILLSVGAGPIGGRVSGRLFRATAALATEVTYRDADSLRTMVDLGSVRADARVTCDLAFGREVAPGPAAAPGPGMRVAVAVMDWGGWSGDDEEARGQYLATLTEAVVGVLDRGHRVVLLVGQPVDVGPAHEVRRSVLSRRPDADLRVADIGAFDDVVDEILGADLVVATRFHLVVAALVSARPVISIGYAPKNRALLTRVGLAHVDRPAEEVTAAWILEQVDAVARDGARYRGSDEVIEGWRRLVRDEVAALATRIG